MILAPSLAHSATLETPGNGDSLSGIGVVRGWKCEANGPLTVRFDGGSPIPLAYGNERADVQSTGACPGSAVGFVSVWNYGVLTTGEHTAVVYDNGVEFARSTFSVVQAGAEYLTDAAGECLIQDFPEVDTNALFSWNTGTQHLELIDLGSADELPAPTSLRYNGVWQLHFLLDEDFLSEDGKVNCACFDGIRFNLDIINGEAFEDGYDCKLEAEVETTALVSPSGQIEGSWYLGITGRAENEPNWLTVGSIDGLLDQNTGEGVGNWVHWHGCIGIWTAVWRGE